MTTTVPCTQPGCTGTILDGYCDVCGSPAAADAAPDVSVATAPAGIGQTPSTVSRASNRLASTALGSARTSAGGTKITRRVGTSSTRLRGARLGARHGRGHEAAPEPGRPGWRGVLWALPRAAPR